MLMSINPLSCFWRNFNAKMQLFSTVTFSLEQEETETLFMSVQIENLNCLCKYLTINFQNKKGFNLFI